MSFDRSLASLPEGIQILREYIFYSNLNFLRLFQNVDLLSKGLVSRDSLQKALLQSPLYFSPSNIEEIFEAGPKSDLLLDYRMLNNLILKSPAPTTRLSFKNLYSPMRIESLLSPQTVTPSIPKNFFDRKQKFQFTHPALQQLEIPLLKSPSSHPPSSYSHPPYSGLYAPSSAFLSSSQLPKPTSFHPTSLHPPFSSGFPAPPPSSSPSPSYPSELIEFFCLNNGILLENFEIICAREIAGKFGKVLVDEILESSFVRFFASFKGQLSINEFKMMMKKLSLLWTDDEIELLHWLIGRREYGGRKKEEGGGRMEEGGKKQIGGMKEQGGKREPGVRNEERGREDGGKKEEGEKKREEQEGEEGGWVTTEKVGRWLNWRRRMRLKEVVKIEKEEGKEKIDESIKIGEVMQEVIGIVKRFGLEFFVSILEPYLMEKKFISRENFKDCLSSLNVNVDIEKYKPFEGYLAESSCMGLIDKENFMFSDCVVKMKELIDLIQKQCEELNVKVESLMEEIPDALKSIQDGIYFQCISMFAKKMEIIMNDACLVNEIDLRMKIINDYPEISQRALTEIFKEMKNNTIYGVRKKIYLPEFISILKTGRKDYFFSNETKPNEKNEKMESFKPFSEIEYDKAKEKNGFVDFPFEFPQPKNLDLKVSIENMLKKLEEKARNSEGNIPNNKFNILINICKKKDYLDEGVINYANFKKILETDLELEETDKYNLLSTAESLAKVIKKDDYGYESQQTLISYHYFCLQIEKYYLLNSIV